ncbi:GTP-binding protein Rho1 [Entophlyctis luteolus]|nr:GTP-binding protein Rho1 [Entophlyctis luteolus]
MHVPTVFANYVADLVVDGTRMQLSLWDTAGQEDYDRLRPLSYPDSHVVLICYAVDSPVSLANIKEKWISEVLHYCRGVPIVLVACKADIRNDPQIIQALAMENERPVTYEEGKRMAQQIGAVGFVECSSRTGQGVREVFEQAARATMKKDRGDSRSGYTGGKKRKGTCSAL